MAARRASDTEGEAFSRALELLETFLASERYQRTFGDAHVSQEVYADEPILKTGRQMKNYLPQEIRDMKGISRLERGAEGAPGRWLPDDEYFYRQARFMADFEDDCPYRGAFKVYYPTYNDMSDQQLRGYFTWRARVRRGRIEETSTSFAYVYLYELICGIGVQSPLEGFRTMEWFWKGYREFYPELDRFAGTWLQDYVVYHGLSPELLAPYRTVRFDRALIALRHAAKRAEGQRPQKGAKRGRAYPPASALPLPADAAFEDELFGAINALSTYRIANSRLYKARPEALRHVACGVFVRTSAYYDKNRKHGALESWFGEHVESDYTMFASAIFFDPARHADCTYELDEIHRYRCTGGRWTCERYHGSRQRSGALGQIMRATDRSLRQALGFAHPLKDDGKTPKYLQKIIDTEVAAWLGWEAWQEANAPKKIEIDLSQLAGIRAAASATREALLVDEEREDAAPAKAAGGAAQTAGACKGGDAAAPDDVGAVLTASAHRANDDACAPEGGPLSPAQASWLRALLLGTDAPTGGREAARRASGLSEDMLVDAINEALFERVGDTVVEFGPDGPELVEDYIEDIREVLEGGAN